jgi:hypothetical protein
MAHNPAPRAYRESDAPNVAVWVIHDRAIQLQCRLLSALNPIATKMVQRRERSDVPTADIACTPRNERGRQLRRPTASLLAGGQLARLLVFLAVSVHLESFTRRLRMVAIVAGLLLRLPLSVFLGVFVHFERFRHRVLHWRKSTSAVAVGSRVAANCNP